MTQLYCRERERMVIGKKHNIIFILFFIITNSLLAQTPETNVKIFKFAWELPNYAEQFDVARLYAWTEPKDVGEAYALFSKTRNSANGDEQAASAFLAFRPFALDFGSFSLTFGVSFVGVLDGFEESDAVEYDTVDIASQTSRMTINARNLEGYVVQNTVNFSVLFSMPAWELQCLLDVGYAWTRLKSTFDISARVHDIDLGGPLFDVEDTIEDYEYIQKDVGFYLSFEIRKFFNREYLNYFSLSIYSLFKLETDARSSRGRVKAIAYYEGAPIDGSERDLGRVNLPTTLYAAEIFEHEVPDPQEGKDFNSNSLGITLITRLISIRMDIPSLLEGQSISVDMVTGVEHNAGELFGSDFHGVGINLGAQLSLFDIIAVGYSYTWQRNNDQEDEWDVFVLVGLYGGVTNNVPLVPRIPG